MVSSDEDMSASESVSTSNSVAVAWSAISPIRVTRTVALRRALLESVAISTAGCMLGAYATIYDAGFARFPEFVRHALNDARRARKKTLVLVAGTVGQIAQDDALYALMMVAVAPIGNFSGLLVCKRLIGDSRLLSHQGLWRVVAPTTLGGYEQEPICREIAPVTETLEYDPLGEETAIRRVPEYDLMLDVLRGGRTGSICLPQWRLNPVHECLCAENGPLSATFWRLACSK